MPRKSSCIHSSAIFPSATRKIPVPATVIVLPVGGMPRNGPCWVAVHETWTATRSPTASSSSIVMCWSGNDGWMNVWYIPLNPSGPRTGSAIPVK